MFLSNVIVEILRSLRVEKLFAPSGKPPSAESAIEQLINFAELQSQKPVIKFDEANAILIVHFTLNL